MKVLEAADKKFSYNAQVYHAYNQQKEMEAEEQKL